jgi:hypothetical protein
MIRTCSTWYVLLGVATSVVLTGAALADTGHWKFELENSSNNSIVEFRTQEDGEWSENWIDNRIEPGDKTELDFETSKGKCSVRTQVRYTNGTFFDADVDYCKATTLEVHDDVMVWK